MQQADDCDLVLVHDDDLKIIDGISEGTVCGHFIHQLSCSSHVGSH